MTKAERKRLEKNGWKVGTAAEFLGLSPAEEALVEIKVHIAEILRGLRTKSRLSQTALAKRIGSSQSRIAKLERNDPHITLDLQMKAIFASRPQAAKEFSALVRKWASAEAQ